MSDATESCRGKHAAGEWNLELLHRVSLPLSPNQFSILPDCR